MLTVAILLVMIIRTYVLTPYKVEGHSMEPSLHHQENILVKPNMEKASINRGDIVVIKGDGNERYVKRVIGLPGDKVEVKQEQLFINDKKCAELYLGDAVTSDFSPILVPAHCYFVMGDNREVSLDSRNGLGFIPEERMIGKGKYVFYPFENMRVIQ